MQAVSVLEPAVSLTSEKPEPASIWTKPIVSLAYWVTGLGVLHFASSLARWVVSFLGGPSSGDALSGLRLLLIENPPIVPLASLWLIVLGILLRRLKWLELLRLSSAVCLVLACVSGLKAAGEWWLGTAPSVAVGSFIVNLNALNRGDFQARSITLLGLIQILAELWISLRAAWLFTRLRDSSIAEIGGRQNSPYGSSYYKYMLVLCGAWIISIGFVVAVVRLPAIPKLSDVMNASPALRRYLLGENGLIGMRHTRTQPMDPNSLAKQQRIQMLLEEATDSWRNKKYGDASRLYEEVIELYQSSEEFNEPHFRSNLAMIQNNLAWLLVTRPDPEPDDPRKAISNAQDALSSSSTDGRYWNTLAAAQYRAKHWSDAKESLLRSMELRGDGDGYDWILFSLIYAQTGRKERALEWFNKAAHFRREYQPWDRDLYEFEAEAARLLDLPSPIPPRAPRPLTRRDDTDSGLFRGRGLPPQLHEPRRTRRGGR